MQRIFHRLRRFGLAAALPCLALGAQAAVITGTGTGGTTLGGAGANQFRLNVDGVGHILLVPYFSAQEGNASILSVVNHDTLNGKALKIRFRGATNGDNLADLTVYLAPGDTWTGLVSQNSSTGVAQLSSADASCTQPSLAQGAVLAFSTLRLNQTLTATERAAQTREGYVEIINTADVPPQSAAGSLYQSIAAGSARNCTAPALAATLTDAATEPDAVARGFGSPSGALRGSWTIINVPQTLTYSGVAAAVAAVDSATGLPSRANYVFFPQSGEPISGNADTLTNDPLLVSLPYGNKSSNRSTLRTYATATIPLVRPLLSDFPDLSTPYLPGVAPKDQAAQLSKVFAVQSLRNEYATDASVAAATEWMFAQPTKRLSVAVDYLQGKVVYSVMTGFDNFEYYSQDNTSLVNGKVCSDYPFVFYDRAEAARNAADNVYAASAYVQLCGAVPVLSFSTTLPSASGASLSTTATGARNFVSGWGRLDLGFSTHTGTPVLGLALVRARNDSAAPGVSANYGMFLPHRGSR